MIQKNNSQLWMVPFADLMSVLVILFLALYVFSTNMKKSDYESAMANLQKELGSKHADTKLKEVKAARKVEDELKKQIADGSLGVEITTAKIKISFSAPVLFDSGSATLKPSAIEPLSAVAQSLKNITNSVIVEGHTDATRMLGKKFASNRELSLMRSFSVIDYLLKQGVPPERLSAFGYGEYRPVAPNDTEENRVKNRRIEITIMRIQNQENTKTSNS